MSKRQLGERAEAESTAGLVRIGRLTGCCTAILLTGLFAVGCGSGSQHDQSSSSTTSTPSAVREASGSAAARPTSDGSRALAVVAGRPITYAEFSHEYKLATLGGTEEGRTCVGQECPVPDPPTFRACATHEREATPSGIKVSTSHLIKNCRSLYEDRIRASMLTLIRRSWAQQAAKRAKITVSAAEVKKLATTKLDAAAEDFEHTQAGEPTNPEAASPPNHRDAEETAKLNAAIQRYMAGTGLAMSDLESEAETRLLLAKLISATPGLRPVHREAPSRPSQSEILAYYRSHRAELSQSKTRDIRIVKTSTLADAKKARSEIEDGESFQEAGHIDPELNSYNNYQTEEKGIAAPGSVNAEGLSSGEDPAIDKAASSTAVGSLVGPVKGEFSQYYVLRPISVHPGKSYPLSVVKRRIERTIGNKRTEALAPMLRAAEARNTRLMAAFARRLARQWIAATSCAKGYVVPLCENSPEHEKPSLTKLYPPEFKSA